MAKTIEEAVEHLKKLGAKDVTKPGRTTIIVPAPHKTKEQKPKI